LLPPRAVRKGSIRNEHVGGGVAGQEVVRIHVFLVAPVNPMGLSVGGTRTYVFGLGRSLTKMGFTVTIVGIGPPVNDGDIAFVAVSKKSLHSNLQYHRFLSRWAKRTRFADGDVIDVQRPDFLCSFIGGSARLGLVSTLHGDPLFAIRQRHSLGALVYGSAEYAGLTASHKVISVSESALPEYIRRYPFLAGKMTHVPNGVDLHTFGPRDRQRERDRLGIRDRPTILYAGRLEPEKRVSVLFDAVSLMPDPPTILIAGSGHDEAAIKARARGTKVAMLGPINHGEMPHVIAAADLVVLPSAFEGMPTIALEALACGVPVAATPVGDLPRLIVPGQTGYFFDGSPKSLRSVLQAHLEDAGKLRDYCVRAAQPYGWDAVGQRMSEVLRAAS